MSQVKLLTNWYFSQITNQMVVSCKDYITEKGVKRIWDFEYNDVMVKIQNAIELYKEYDRSFQVCSPFSLHLN